MKAGIAEGIDWWAEELPSEEEYERGLKNLEIANNTVDSVLSHTASEEVVAKLSVDRGLEIVEEEQLQQYLQGIANSINFQSWYYGHFHEDIDIDNIRCVMEEVIRIA